MSSGGISFSPVEVSIYYAERVPKLRQRGRQWRGPCPLHGGKNDNLSVDPKTGKWRCWSECNAGGDIVDFEERITGVSFLDAVAAIESIAGRPLLERPTSRAEAEELARRRARDMADMRAAEHFKIGVEHALELILKELPELSPERYAPTQALLEVRRVGAGVDLRHLYRNWREREPDLTRGLVYAGERSWERTCTRLARFIDAGAEVPNAA
ncbi:MAG TPA: CHC2 zinc finger domain-containing protein [Bryobacteraceae bacterium]